MINIEEKLVRLAQEYTKTSCIAINKIPQSGSNRQYFRLLFRDNPSLIAVYNGDVRENRAFFYYTDFFSNNNINVPQIFHIDESKKYYLLEDLGDETLFSYLTKHHNPENENLEADIFKFYEKTVKMLPRIQNLGRQNLNFQYAYPRDAFDNQSMMWDLNYFKYYFLKLINLFFDEQELENDFQTFINFLLRAESDFFLFRDFQSRNIMLKNDNVYFIDYQGGRRGALQYDLASLLYDGKANLSNSDREKLFAIYLDEAEKVLSIERQNFIRYFDGFVLIRILQALGAYGYRGYFERKSHFLLSIPYALKNLSFLLENSKNLPDIPLLRELLVALIQSPIFPSLSKRNILTVTITSFSYKKGIPQDFSANGGGFVFDCRALPNPGREKLYANATGKDISVIAYLEKYSEVAQFKERTFALVESSVNNYLERKFTNLMVNFGCTGGQHRSVYFAEQLQKYLKEKYSNRIHIELKHTNLPN